MKKSKLLRVLLIAFAVAMTFSLFACTPTSDQPPSNDEESTSDTIETEPKDLGDSSEATSEDSSEETSEETTETPACEHIEETVPGTPATCENTGLTPGKKCSVCGETLVEQQVIPALEHKWVEDKVITAAECEKDGEMSYVCANDATHKKTEPIPAFGHGTEGKTWKYISNNDTKYKDTRYAVEGAECNSCGKILETRAAVIAFNLDSITAADGTGANATFAGTGSGYGEMVYDPAARVTANEAIYLRNNQFIVASGWVGINGDFDTSNAYYRILDENGDPLTDWVEKLIYDSGSNVPPVEKDETAGSYKSVKGQLAEHGVTDFVARGFKTNNLNTTINGVDYAKYDKPISIEYALKAVDAPEGSDLITLIVFKNVYKVCTSHSCDWKYVSGEGTEFEGTGYAVQGGTCKNCGEYVTRAAVIAYNFDNIVNANANITGVGTGSSAMVYDPDARVYDKDAIYLKNNEFIVGYGWLGVAGDIDTEWAYYRILNNETGEALTDWQQKVIYDSGSNVAPVEKAESTGSYSSVNNQLSAHGITDFTARGFKTNNLNTTIGGTAYASADTPIAIEYAVKVKDAPEGYDLIRVIIFKNIYKAS